MSTNKKDETKDTYVDAVDAAIGQWHRERPDLDPSAMGILARIGRIESLRKASQEEVFARHGLNWGMFDVLSTLLRSGPPYSVTPGHLAEASMLTTGGMTGRVDKLEKAGWVTREPDPEDRRMLRIKLTPEGHTLINNVVEEHFANGDRILAQLDASQREQLASLLAACERSVAASGEHDSSNVRNKNQGSK